MDDISIMPLDRTRQAYPKHGIYYSSIFTPLRVIHLRDTITGSDLILKSCLSGHFIFVSDHIKLCPDSLQPYGKKDCRYTGGPYGKNTHGSSYSKNKRFMVSNRSYM